MTAHTSKVDQTIFVDDPEREGNCMAACVATILGRPLEQVPHFVEHYKGEGNRWWYYFLGYMAGAGYWVREAYLAEVPDDELVLVGGPSERGAEHMVIYRGGELWHDPHPSRAGVLQVNEAYVLQACVHDHTPTQVGDPA